MNKPEWGWLNTPQVLRISSEIAEYFLMNHYGVHSSELYNTNKAGDSEGLREEYEDEFSVIYDDMEHLIKQNVKVKDE